MTWAHYILQVNIYLVVFYGFYKLLLDKETYFFLNRIYLLSAGVLSLAIPLLRFEWFTTQPVTQPVYTGMAQFNEMITQAVVLEESPEQWNASDIVVGLYLLGVVFFVARFIIQLYTVRKLLKNVTTGTAFSFFKKKIIDKNLPGISVIEKHEEIHIRQWHTLDVLFFEALGILNWFNPAIYFYKHNIKDIHEYLADEEAAKSQGDKEQYALLLLSTAFGIKPNQLTNSFFNKSLIKKRIYMLHKQRSTKIAALKYGLFLPLFAITLVMSSATVRENRQIQSIAEELPLEESVNIVTDVIRETKIAEVLTATTGPALKKPVVEKSFSEFQEGQKADMDWKAFYRYIASKTKYSFIAQEKGIQGNVYIKFTVKNSQIEDLGIVGKPLGAGSDSQAMGPILAYTGFDETADGKYILPIHFRLPNAETPIQNESPVTLKDHKVLSEVVVVGYGKPATASSENSGTGEDPIYSFVAIEKQPTFPGGMKAFYEYLSKNVKYPKEALENKVSGNVYLSYVVEKDGSLTNIKVDRKLGSGTDEEAVRVLKESPKWIPGVQNGKTVRVKYNIPIRFNLDKQGKAVGDFERKSSTSNLKNIDPEKAPIFIVDGKKTSPEEFSVLKPSDIHSIMIYKDQSFIDKYGSDAKNGVMIIITKKSVSENTTTETPSSTKKN